MIYIEVNLPGPKWEGETHSLSIQRMAGDAKADSMNTYRVVLDAGEGISTYEHRFGDGWLVCVSKALQALSEDYR